MKPERGNRNDGAVIPRLTPALRFNYDHIDEDHFYETGEFLAIKVIEQQELVDPFDEGLAPEAYWAEGWNLGYYQLSGTKFPLPEGE